MLEHIFNLDINFGVNMGVHSLFLFSFLSAFFVFYISKISKNAIEDELENNIQSALGDQLVNLPDAAKSSLRTLPFNQLKKMYSRPEKAMEVNNTWLFKTILLVNVMLWAMLIFVIILLKTSCRKELNIMHILLENGIAFSFIGLVEYLFFTKIALKFIPVNPSVIPKEFINSLKTSL